MEPQKPGLFGLENSNKDFRKPDSWGKNTFNNSFPVALMCYMYSKQMQPVYFTLSDQLGITKDYIAVEDVFGLKPLETNTYFSFETPYTPYQTLVVGNLPRADVVVMDAHTSQCYAGIEIKLTALPDNSTWQAGDSGYGCEIVVRPDTIVYIALSIAASLKADPTLFENVIRNLPQIEDWTKADQVLPHVPAMTRLLDEFLLTHLHLQLPLVLQPIWKTEGKKLTLHQDAFDVFIWSNFAFTRLFFRDTTRDGSAITRGARSIVWLLKMLMDFVIDGKIDHRRIIDQLSYNTKNDKAFAVNGMVTRQLMKSEELVTPRLKRHEIKSFILGGGEKLLSPERRLDAAIVNTPGLFNS